MVRSPRLIRRPRGVFVTRLLNSDGGDYSKERDGVSSRGGCVLYRAELSCRIVFSLEEWVGEGCEEDSVRER